jgi:YYY domain-containing protein
MLDFLSWYLVITIIGLVTFPITYRLLPSLPDRGYAFSRILGLLIWAYLFWLLASLGVLRNDIGGLSFGLAVLLVISFLAFRQIPTAELRNWWSSNRRLVIFIEALFLVAFAGWAFVRAANPEILGTEKPMELAFINAILRSPVFPPQDPWLSGYSISYYYFGYVMTAMLAKLTATPGSIAFNLALALVFALSAVASFGIVYSLLVVFRSKKPFISQSVSSNNLILSLLGPTFILLVSNLEGFLEVLHARGLFWIFNGSAQPHSGFWSWLDMQELSSPPSEPLSWIPSRYLWWWRASRVVQDYDLAGNFKEVIDEFPFFSYLLGDLHPHVLVMPFAFLSIGLILNLFLGGGEGSYRWLGIRLAINPSTFWSSALVIGGLAFLNTWDFPMYLFFFSLVYVISRALNQRSKKMHIEEEISNTGNKITNEYSYAKMIKDFILLSIALGISGVLLYLPFYISFSSQAGGILPNLVFSTRGAHLWVMFGALFIPLFVYLIYLWKSDRTRFRIRNGLLIVIAFMGSLWLISLLLGVGISTIQIWGDMFIDSIGGLQGASLLIESVRSRIFATGWVTIGLLLVITISYLLTLLGTNSVNQERNEDAQEKEATPPQAPVQAVESKAQDFTMLLILMGGLLVLFTEFFYLLDQFGSRMNTVFKFYFQTWIFWGLAAAFAVAILLQVLRSIWGILFRIVIAIVFLMAFAYPLFSLWNKTNGFKPRAGFSLDGAAYLETRNSDEAAGINWLKFAEPGVVLEAVGGSYSEYARVATLSGQQNVIGWPGHESQWRGGVKEIGNREGDVEIIYRSNNWDETMTLIDLYNIRYIYIGPLERISYPVNEAKFQQFLGEAVFTSGDVSIYEIPRDRTISGVY